MTRALLPAVSFKPSRFRFAVGGVAQLRACDVKPFDRLDFEGDKFADPQRYADPYADIAPDDLAYGFEYEFAEVREIDSETPDCIILHTSQGSFAFPSDHLIDSTLEQPNADMTTVRNSGERWHAWFGDGHSPNANVGGFLTEVEAIEALHAKAGL